MSKAKQAAADEIVPAVTNNAIREKLAAILQKLPSKVDLAVLIRYGGLEGVVERLEAVRTELSSIIGEIE
jgi:hypothetical protein